MVIRGAKVEVLFADKEKHPELEKYIKKKGKFCPFCGSDELEWEKLRFDYKYPTQEVTCKTCDQEWLDEYKRANFFWFIEKRGDG